MSPHDHTWSTLLCLLLMIYCWVIKLLSEHNKGWDRSRIFLHSLGMFLELIPFSCSGFWLLLCCEWAWHSSLFTFMSRYCIPLCIGRLIVHLPSLSWAILKDFGDPFPVYSARYKAGYLFIAPLEIACLWMILEWILVYCCFLFICTWLLFLLTSTPVPYYWNRCFQAIVCSCLSEMYSVL